jgi:hypothetical protein
LEELTAVARPDGPYAVFDFNGALPRTRLYANWQINTNDDAVLKQLAGTNFNPAQTVIVANPSVGASATSSTNQTAGTAEITSYMPKKVSIRAKATASSVLLLNDKFDPNWKVFVDGKPDTVLRCNYLMRGVKLSPGEHLVQFSFQPDITGLWVSLAAIAIAFSVLTLLIVSPKSEERKA